MGLAYLLGKKPNGFEEYRKKEDIPEDRNLIGAEEVREYHFKGRFIDLRKVALKKARRIARKWNYKTMVYKSKPLDVNQSGKVIKLDFIASFWR